LKHGAHRALILVDCPVKEGLDRTTIAGDNIFMLAQIEAKHD
jgi:hypothetical protein